MRSHFEQSLKLTLYFSIYLVLFATLRTIFDGQPLNKGFRGSVRGQRWPRHTIGFRVNQGFQTGTSKLSRLLMWNSLIARENSALLSRSSSAIGLFKISLIRSRLKVISDIAPLRDLWICLTVDAICSKPS